MKIIVDASHDIVPKHGTFIQNSSDFYTNILASLDYPIGKEPVANLLSRLHSLEGNWFVISPIHWQATHNDGMLVASGSDFSLSEPEGREWFTELTKFVATEDIKVHYHDACTWLIQANGHNNKSKSVYSLLNKSIMPELESLDDSFFWQRFITESQMFLNNHPLNKKRAGKISINGFWVWGGGSLKPIGTRKIIACDKFAFKIANILSSNVSLYFNNPKILRNSIIICSSDDILSRLPQKITKKTLYWYWNNFAYKIEPNNWFKRLFK